jgi:ABC-2 type transport system permease protein
VRLFLHQVRTEQLMFWRNREAAIFVFVFPPLLYLLLGAVYNDEIDGDPAATVLLAGLIGYGCANTAFAGLAITLVIRREGGVLKRLRATPLPAPTYLAAVLVSTLLVFALQMVVTVLLGVLLYDAAGAENWLTIVLAAALGGVCFAGMGFGATALIRSSEGASAVVNLVVLPMAFLSGSFGPTRSYPDILRWIGDATPLRYLVDLLEDGYLRGADVWSNPAALGVLAAWGAAGFLLAARRFRWMPRER